MNIHFKKLLLVSAMSLAGMAHAETIDAPNATWSVGGSGSLSFSKSLLTALNAGSIDVTEVAPATASITRNPVTTKYTAISANAPIASVSGDFDGTNLALKTVVTSGGANLLATADDLTNSGGSLSITNIGVNLASKTVFADIDGGNGVNKIKALPMWIYTTIDGPTSVLATGGVNSADNVVLKGLVITPDAKAAFINSLGLLESGVAALNRITDYGVLTSSISVTSPPVPEPESVALGAVGLLTVAALRRKKKATA